MTASQTPEGKSNLDGEEYYWHAGQGNNIIFLVKEKHGPNEKPKEKVELV